MGEIRPNKNGVKDLLAANRGVVQAAGSWSMDACCAVHGNECSGPYYCDDHTSSSDWLFGLWPGPPQRFEPTGTDTSYQHVDAYWPIWNGDLSIGHTNGNRCDQGGTCLLYTSPSPRD